MKRLRISIIILVSFLLLILIPFFIFKTVEKKQHSSGLSQNNIYCSLAGQKPLFKLLSRDYIYIAEDLRYDAPRPKESFKRDLLIHGRILSTNPFIYQDTLKNDGRILTMPVDSEEIGKLKKLNFSDYFTANKYQYETALSGPTGLFFALTNFKKINTNEKIPDVIFTYFNDYDENIEGLVISSDGNMEIWDKLNTVIEYYPPKQLLEDFFSALRKNDFNSYEQVDFKKNKSPYTLTYDNMSPSIGLFCARIQVVKISDNQKKLEPIMQEINKLVKDAKNQKNLYITYASKDPIRILPWPFDFKLSEFQILKDKLERNKDSDMKNPLNSQVPSDFYNTLPLGDRMLYVSTTTVPYFIEDNRIYQVSRINCFVYGGEKCISPVKFFKDLYVFELSNYLSLPLSPQAYVKFFNEHPSMLLKTSVWPEEIKIKLPLENKRLKVDLATYEKYKAFFQGISEHEPALIQDDHIFYKVKFVR
jgi:hypothetical protein